MARPLRILVIDDDDDLRLELVELLCAMQFAAEGCANAEDALNRVDANDVLLCDLDLGAESGIELIRTIQSRAAPRPSVIAMSGRVDLLNLFAESGNIPLLSKPTRISSLLDAIKACDTRRCVA
jgi:DNA-binding response OmpR family regulator